MGPALLCLTDLVPVAVRTLLETVRPILHAAMNELQNGSLAHGAARVASRTAKVASRTAKAASRTAKVASRIVIGGTERHSAF